MTYEVKLAEEKDIDWLVNIAGYNMIAFEVARPEWFDPVTFYTMARKSVEDKTCLIVFKDNEPVGTLGGILVPHQFNPKFTVLSEILWYVLPEHRKSRCGYMLLKAYSDMALTVADMATMSIMIESSEVSIESVEKFGFKLKEFGFYKEK